MSAKYYYKKLRKLPLLKKTQTVRQTTYRFCGLPILSYKYTSDLSKYHIYFMGLPIISIRRMLISTRYRFFCISYRKYHKQKFPLLTKNILKQASKTQSILWWDHSLGGGTEYYFSNQKARLLTQYVILRVQYIPSDECYQLTLFQSQRTYSIICSSFKQLKPILNMFSFQQIVVNNLVSYSPLFECLHFISKLQAKNNTFVSFRLHDFFALCPFSFNLMYQDHFCQGPTATVCAKCAYTKVEPTRWKTWRYEWGNFLSNTVNEIITFSQSSCKLLLQAYPKLTSKTKIIPHQVPFLRKVHVSPHTGIHIAVLGNINNDAKGLKILNRFEHLITRYPNITLTVIGTYLPQLPKTQVSGKYDRQNLPDLLEKYQTDIIFIPSVCPETFSYTTSEAILCGLPVACFDIGAQAEKVKMYSKGLIIKNITAEDTLHHILLYMKSAKPVDTNLNITTFTDVPRLLVHLHLHYQNQWLYFQKKLSHICDCSWDLYVTLTKSNKLLEQQIRQFKPNAQIFVVSNRGYDIWPFLQVLYKTDLSAYDYVLKLHSKQEIPFKIPELAPHYPSWRKALVEPLLGTPAKFQYALQKMKQGAGLCCAGICVLQRQYSLPEDTWVYQKLIQKLNLSLHTRWFVAGSIFLIQSTCLKVLQSFPLTEQDFSLTSHSNSTGSMAHTIERIFIEIVQQTQKPIILLDLPKLPNAPLQYLTLGRYKFMYHLTKGPRRQCYEIKINNLCKYLKGTL